MQLELPLSTQDRSAVAQGSDLEVMPSIKPLQAPAREDWEESESSHRNKSTKCEHLVTLGKQRVYPPLVLQWEPHHHHHPTSSNPLSRSINPLRFCELIASEARLQLLRKHLHPLPLRFISPQWHIHHHLRSMDTTLLPWECIQGCSQGCSRGCSQGASDMQVPPEGCTEEARLSEDSTAVQAEWQLDTSSSRDDSQSAFSRFTFTRLDESRRRTSWDCWQAIPMWLSSGRAA